MDNSRRIRPVSTVAESFSQDLDSLFGLNSGVADLSETVEAKKRNVSSQSQELAAIEARLRETEERLARVSRPSPSSRSSSQHRNPLASLHPEHLQSGHIPRQQTRGGAEAASKTSPLAAQSQGYNENGDDAPSGKSFTVPVRPYNAREDSLGLPPIPGAMPKTPTPANDNGNDYMTANRTR